MRAALLGLLRHGWSAARADEILRGMETLPGCDLDELLGRQPALVLSPHPDDESLGCGGLIAEAVSRGYRLHLATLTDGTGSHPGSRAYPAPRRKELREQETLRAAGVLGIAPDHVVFLAARDGAAPHRGPVFRGLVARVADLVRRHGIGTILTTWPSDPHTDHVAACRIARAAADATGTRLLTFPVWGWTLPPSRRLPRAGGQGFRLDIARHLPRKRAAIAAHRSQTTDLIQDDPTGFRLSEDVLAILTRPYEVFLLDESARGGQPAARRR